MYFFSHSSCLVQLHVEHTSQLSSRSSETHPWCRVYRHGNLLARSPEVAVGMWLPSTVPIPTRLDTIMGEVRQSNYFLRRFVVSNGVLHDYEEVELIEIQYIVWTNHRCSPYWRWCICCIEENIKVLASLRGWHRKILFYGAIGLWSSKYVCTYSRYTPPTGRRRYPISRDASPSPVRQPQVRYIWRSYALLWTNLCSTSDLKSQASS